MNWPKPGKPSGREAPMEDPALVRGLLESLIATEAEFPIKVEGTSTLPYAAVVKELDLPSGIMLLKLVRPLPHELLSGAVFRMVFAVEEQRFEALVAYRQREAYLTYSFQIPAALSYSDRRMYKRYPFRPRERAFVIAQDGGLPGLGVAGPLMNVGLGGVALRVDRVLKLDDGMRIPPSTALFDRGKAFPRIRIQELPRLPHLEVRGVVAHATERGPEILLGLQFVDLDEKEARLLRDSLEFRERIIRGSGGGISSASNEALTGAPAPRREEEAAERPSREPALAPAPEAPKGPDPLLLLRRRGTRLALVQAPGRRREELLAHLKEQGYLRLDVADSIPALAQLLGQEAAAAPVQLLLADLSAPLAEVGEPLAAVRLLESQAAGLGDISTVILCEALDPTMILAQEKLTRFAPLDEGGVTAVGPMLDRLLGLVPEEGG